MCNLCLGKGQCGIGPFYGYWKEIKFSVQIHVFQMFNNPVFLSNFKENLCNLAYLSFSIVAGLKEFALFAFRDIIQTFCIEHNNIYILYFA